MEVFQDQDHKKDSRITFRCKLIPRNCFSKCGNLPNSARIRQIAAKEKNFNTSGTKNLKSCESEIVEL